MVMYCFRIAVGFLSLAQIGDAEEVLSVCSALTRSAALHGKIVLVRGEWIIGPEQNMLRAYGCPDEVSLGGRIRPAAINLSSSVQWADRLRVRISERSIRRALGVVRTAGDAEYVGVVVVTLKGILESDQVVGFGHLNAFPAQLNLLEAYKPNVVWTKKKNPMWGVPTPPW